MFVPLAAFHDSFFAKQKRYFHHLMRLTTSESVFEFPVFPSPAFMAMFSFGAVLAVMEAQLA